MAESGPSPKAEEDEEEHEEGEISDEDLPPLTGSEGEGETEARVVGQEEEELDTTGPPSNRDPPLLRRLASLDDLIDLGSGGELRATAAAGAGQIRKRTEKLRGKEELESNVVEESSNALKRQQQQQQQQQRREFPSNGGGGAYGSNLYNFAWAQAVAGRPSFSQAAAEKSPSSPNKESGDGLLSPAWPTESRKLSREFGRDMEMYSSRQRSPSSPKESGDGSLSFAWSSENWLSSKDLSREQGMYKARPNFSQAAASAEPPSSPKEPGDGLLPSVWGLDNRKLGREFNNRDSEKLKSRPSFSSQAATIESPPSPKLSREGSLSSAWSSENRKLSRDNSRELEIYKRGGKSSEERDDLSPVRQNGSSRRGGERGSSERGEGRRARRSREVWEERAQPVRSRSEKSDLRLVGEGEDYQRGALSEDGEEGRRRRRRRSDSESSNGKLEDVENGGRSSPEASGHVGRGVGEKSGEAEEREEGELEEGEIELGSLPADAGTPPASPSRPAHLESSRASKYNGSKTVDYRSKDKSYTRSLSKTQSGSQVEDYTSRSSRHRQAKPQESYREKRLLQAGDLVKNVTVKDAQKAFVDVCSRLYKAVRVLEEVRTERQSAQQEGGRLESRSNEITVLSRQAFAGIRAVYAVRNTASGREQERDKDIFPRLLGLANGFCQKLFTPKQKRELEVMMQTIANAGRLARESSEKGQNLRELPVQSAPKKSKDDDPELGDPLGNNIGSVKLTAISETKSSSESGIAGRIVGSVEAKQAEEAAAIAAAALAYAQSSAAARASSLFGSTYDQRSSGTHLSGTGISWGWLSDHPRAQFPGHGLSSLPPITRIDPSIVKYQPWNEPDHRLLKSGPDGYAGHSLEARPYDPPTTGSSAPDSSKEETNAPPGYSKRFNTYGMLEDDWEELSPPGAGISNYVPLPAASVQAGAIKEESAGKVWTSRQEMGAVQPFQKSKVATAASLYSMEHMERLPSPTHTNNKIATRMYPGEQLPTPTHPKSRGSTSQFSAERLPSPSHENSRGTAPGFPGLVYAAERLPSPTPDEDEKGKVVPGELKSSVIDGDSKKLGITQSQQVGNLPDLISSRGFNHHVIRSQSLPDAPVPLIEPRTTQFQKSAEAMMSPVIAKSSGDTEAAKAPYSFPPKGNSRSRDPRRRFQNHSLDSTEMTEVFGMDPSRNPNLAPSWNLGDAYMAPAERNKKRFASEVDDQQDTGSHKRQKGQFEISVDASELNIDVLHAPAGTGGWLDDNFVPSFGTAEEIPVAMEVDEEGPSSVLDLRTSIGSDLKINGEDEGDAFLEVLNSSRKQMMDVGQQTGEAGPRRMKPRDPRRALLEAHIERDLTSSSDLNAVTVTSSKGEAVVVSMRTTTETSQWSSTDSGQAIKPGLPMPNMAPHFLEKFSGLVGMAVSSSITGSVSQSHVLVHPGGAQVVPSASVTEPKGGLVSKSIEASIVEVSSVSSEAILRGLPEHQKDKSATVSTGSRKPKGSPSQWGASQLHPGLEKLLGDLTDEERRSVQLERERRMEEQERMFSAGKLCLVLDLDHTLLNSAKFSEIEQEWEQRLRAAEVAERNRAGRDGLERRELYRFPHMSMWTKLRPGIWKFLARASQLYELHVYTMGNKVYATEMAKLLDPTGKLFAGRVISKGDDGDGDDLLPKSKDLDGVLGMESAVVIIDDSARVWPHHSENLIVVERYMYFPCSRRQFGLAGPSLLEVGHDERETDGMLASALGVIDRIHQKFFKNSRLNEVDVREILAAQQRQVLAGCKVVFSRVFPVGEAEPHKHPLWRTAEQFGAICSIAIDDQVTHVVAISQGTDKVNWALETGRHVVRPAWLEASTILYRRANERDFRVLQP